MATTQDLLVFTTKEEMRAWSRQQRAAGRKIGFVPTMGYLHDGHLSLVQAARERADVVVASIYVNPTQFAAHEDFDVYPRDADADRAKLKAAGCAAVFEPAAGLYHQPAGTAEGSNVVGRESGDPDAHETFVQVERLQRPLCGGSRPHFFRGVATIVTKLFHIVEPDVAVFGRKDYQQWRVLSRMARDLDFAVEIVGMPIAREPDGLAMSSRNARLTAEARQAALAIPTAVKWAEAQAAAGGASAAELVAEVKRRIEAAGGKVDYVELRDAEHLGAVTDLSNSSSGGGNGNGVLLAVAAWFPANDGGTVRLIDNTVLRPGGGGGSGSG